MKLKPIRTLCLAVICHACFPLTVLHAQGTATGWVVANAGDSSGEIAPGQNSTNVLAGAGSLTTTNSGSSPDGAVDAEASFPDVKLSVDSSNLALGQVAYGGAYFEDSITILGGVGSFQMSMRWSFDGGISGAGGESWVGQDPGIGARDGSAAVNFRVFNERFGHSTLDLADTDLFKDLALEPTGQLDVPFFDPFEGPDGSSNLPGFNSISNFLFDELDDGEPTGGFVEAWYTDTNANFLSGLGGGTTFDWEYGVPLEFGVLLEGWAADGGAVDFFNTGTFTELLLPAGASLVSSGGGVYNITNAVPEPSSAAVLLVGMMTVCARRRRRQ